MDLRLLFFGLCICFLTPALCADGNIISPDPGTVILGTVPDVRQSTGFSCGASSLQAVLAYWGIDTREGDLIELLKSTPDAGTPPGNIVVGASSFGLNAFISENMTIDDLKSYVQKKIPVIVDVQAWNGEYDENGDWVVHTPDSWEQVWEDGHYMVVIGVDGSNVYLEDPSLLGSRGVIPVTEFLSRWHDYEGVPGSDESRVITNHLGIIIKGSDPARYPAYTLVT
ncbi:MAG: C39 family peptidase [Methanospirillum sp.]|uniref:C39 family peptidase n=1 Tax=Methanospirillum sp. TaxID=45200 RepID=UPI0023715CED|nr:C39 family peptidase [Methanospirillum sp.]MDD1729082.1 C39 family peptidase [Methanospirillum sp.]